MQTKILQIFADQNTFIKLPFHVTAQSVFFRNTILVLITVPMRTAQKAETCRRQSLLFSD